jgi:hypothetical protein
VCNASPESEKLQRHQRCGGEKYASTFDGMLVFLRNIILNSNRNHRALIIPKIDVHAV